MYFDRSLTTRLDARERMKLWPKYQKTKDICPVFNHHEMRCLLHLFRKLTRGKGYMNRDEFIDSLTDLFLIDEPAILERMYLAVDIPNTIGIKFEQWVTIVALFARGSLEEKITFAFLMYDTLGLGYVTKDTVFKKAKEHIVTITDTESHADNIPQDYAEELMKVLDLDNDGDVSFEDFHEAVWKHPILLDVLGQCFPDREYMDTFLTTFTTRVGEEYLNKMERRRLSSIQRMLDKKETSFDD